MKYLSSHINNITSSSDLKDLIFVSSFLLNKHFNGDFSFYTDCVKKYDFFFSLSKILSIEKTEGDFCYIDTDVLLYDKSVLETDCDFLFYSLDTTISHHYSTGIKLLDFFDAIPLSLKDSKLDFQIYNTGIILCKKREVFNMYLKELYYSLELLDKYNDVITNRLFPEKSLKDIKICITLVLEQLLLSKIVKDQNCSVGYIYEDIKKGDVFSYGNDEFKLNHLITLKHNKEILDKLKDIANSLKSNKLSKELINSFFKGERLIEIPKGEELFRQFLEESNKGSCSKCQLNRVKRKYSKILNEIS